MKAGLSLEHTSARLRDSFLYWLASPVCVTCEGNYARRTSSKANSSVLLAANLAQIKTLFPEAFTEGKVDFDGLKQLHGSH